MKATATVRCPVVGCGKNVTRSTLTADEVLKADIEGYKKMREKDEGDAADDDVSVPVREAVPLRKFPFYESYPPRSSSIATGRRGVCRANAAGGRGRRRGRQCEEAWERMKQRRRRWCSNTTPKCSVSGDKPVRRRV